MNILVLGIGQSLRGDDAAGLEAVRRWQTLHPATAARVRVEVTELPGLGLLDLLKGMDAAVLVDAVRSEQPAGTLLVLGQDDLAAFTPGSGSAHGWGAAETLALGRRLNPSLADLRLTLIGIAGTDFSMGAELRPEVRAALDKAAEAIERKVNTLL
jgi:hydrogenase maturation protease